ncbi:MFS transporter [Sphingomonas sp. 3P27F8]|uniref:MFS transporter n=1 Tax=Sphingomonas sp. 3P27F8 TaxID=2502213 RepID=UPI0014853C87|nr:MFS transporter [Sphingomonas sp. 3P27F8]
MTVEFRQNWRPLLGCAIGLAFGASILLYINGAFVTAFQKDFGWSRSQMATVSLINVLTVIPFSPVAGAIVDRFGVRRIAVIGLLGLALGFFLQSRMSGYFPEYIAINILMCTTGLFSTSLCFSRLINERFDAARGMALGAAAMGSGLMGAVAPPVLAHVIGSHGWRAALVYMALVVLAAIPVVWLLLGQDRRTAKDSAATPVAGDVPVSVVAMFRDTRFVRLSLIFFFMALGVTGFTFHLIPMLTDGGMSPVGAASVQGIFGLAMISGRIVLGSTVDTFFAPRIAACIVLVTVAGIASFSVVGMPAAPFFAFAIGFSMGVEGDLIGYLNARYFGLHGYAKRYGVLFSVYLLANGLSPVLIALGAEQLGGYRPTLWLCAAATFIPVILLLTAPPFDASRQTGQRRLGWPLRRGPAPISFAEPIDDQPRATQRS